VLHIAVIAVPNNRSHVGSPPLRTGYSYVSLGILVQPSEATSCARSVCKALSRSLATRGIVVLSCGLRGGLMGHAGGVTGPASPVGPMDHQVPDCLFFLTADTAALSSPGRPRHCVGEEPVILYC
jgi:hypothetical protein